ncbi:MAG: hypothetical protein J6A01_02130 [Proteobacteria bacterium]|nr:hypothetical protein [Pseudomonadota bacterium]
MPKATEDKKKESQSKAASEPKKAGGTSADMPAQAETTEETQNKTTQEAVEEALSKSDGAAVVDALSGATAADLKKLATKDIITKIMTLDKANKDAALDLLYSYVTDVNLLISMVDSRFGVPIGSAAVSDPNDISTVNMVKQWFQSDGTPEQAWTLNGVMHVYSTYLRLPQQDLDVIKAVFTLKTNQSSVSGAAYMDLGIYYVNYNNNNPNAKENGGHTEKKSDTRNGLVMLDMTIAHEFGHCVDRSRGDLSETPDFMAISGWEKHPKSSPENLFDAIVASFNNPYPSNFSDKEKTVARKAGAEMITQRAVNNAKRDAILEKVVEDEYEEPENASSRSLLDRIFNPKSGGRTSASLVKALKKSNAINHVVRGFADNSPWYSGELFSGMNRQIHEAYSWQDCWFSFKNEAWKRGKISRYQFRAPMEEFAELYGSYHVAEPKGSHTPEPLKSWFESKGLDKMEATEDKDATNVTPKQENTPGGGGK